MSKNIDCFARARRACFLAVLFIGLAAGMLVWAGTALIAVGMTDVGYTTLGLAAIASVAASLISPRTATDDMVEAGD